MESWIIWEQVCRVMAALFMVTSLAAAVAAGILLFREDLTKRLGREYGTKYLRRLGILALLAVCVWILIIGQSARAAEKQGNTAGEEDQPGAGTTESESALNPEIADEVEPAGDPAEEEEKTGRSGEDAPRREEAFVEGSTNASEGGTNPSEDPSVGSTQPQIRDTKAPEADVQMADEVNRDVTGAANCRSDNAGIKVTLTDSGEEDTGICFYRVTVSDAEGKEIVREWSRGEGESRERIEFVIETEEVSELSDGKVGVAAEAEDEAGNRGESSLSFILDTSGPVLTQIITYGSGTDDAKTGQPVAERTLYGGGDLYYRDLKLTTQIRIEEQNEVNWEISFLEFPGLDAGSGSSVDRQKKGSGSEGSIVISKEGVYGGFRICGEDIAGNRLRASADCRCTQDAENFYEESGGICLPARKIIDRTAPEAVISYSSGADGYRYMEKSGETVYFGGDLRARMTVSDFCGDLRMPADEAEYRLVRWSGDFETADRTVLPPGTTAVVSDDSRVRFGAFGTDRAGNGLTVTEIFEDGVYKRSDAKKKTVPYAPGPARTDQRGLQECAPGTAVVRDTVKPVLTSGVTLPAGNEAGIDRTRGIVYFGGDSSFYEGGEKSVRAVFEVEDVNADPDRVEIRTACAQVPEGGSCEKVTPKWEDAARESAGAVQEENILRFEIVKIPGSESMPDGVYRFGIAGTDKAGNPLTAAEPEAEDRSVRNKTDADENAALQELTCEDSRQGIFMTGRKVVDTKAPSGTVRIVNGSGEEYCRIEAHRGAWAMDQKSFMPYRREKEAVIECSVRDTSPASVSCRIISTQGGRNDEGPDGTDYKSGCTETVRISGGQVFRMEQVVLRDRAGNRSAALVRTVNFYLDTQIPDVDINKPSVSVTATSQITRRNPDGRALYGKSVRLTISAEDPAVMEGASGLREVRCDLFRDGRTIRDGVILFSSESASGDGEQPVYTYEGTVDIPSGGEWESNDIEIAVTARDNAGNCSNPESGGVCRFGIDSTGPDITVSYDNNEVINGKYLAGSRKAVVTVRERNFSTGGIRITAPGVKPDGWRFVRGGSSGDEDEWVTELSFIRDGEYTLAIDGTDALGNTAAVTYTGEAPQSFVVDKTPPVIDVIWDGCDVRNGKYYNEARRASVRITDLSFDERGVKIVPHSSGFRKTGELSWETEIRYEQDGEWNLGCACTDLAGNTAVPVLESSFVIDRTPPRMYFDTDTVKEMGAYGEEICPRLRWEEENPSGSSCYAVWNNLTREGCTMERRSRPADGGADLELPDPPMTEGADGICVLSAGMCDLAGNRVYIRRNLSVNRFGSVYDISEDPDTLEIVNSCYTDAGKPFVVAEYNVSPLVSREVTLYRNGVAVQLTEGEDYTVAEERRGSGMKYVYRIEASAFCEEGKYSVLLQSTDETGRQNSSPGRFRLSGASHSDLKGQDGEGTGSSFSPFWAVDRTPPVLRIAGVDTGRHRFVTDCVPVTLIPSDNLELSELRVRIRGDNGEIFRDERIGKRELRELLDRNRGELQVRIEASPKWQTLEAEVTDGAGNRSGAMTDTGSAADGNAISGYRLLVSASPIVHIYRSGLLPAIAFLALIGAVALTCRNLGISG